MGEIDAMNLPDKCPFCGAGVRAVKDGNQRWVEFDCFSTIGNVGGEFQHRSPVCTHTELNAAKARVARLEELVREAEESNANALARLNAAEATIELRRLENEAVRRQLGHAENACDAMEKRVLGLEARCKRLEEAAREVYLDSIASDHPWSEMETRNMHALRDVLETKP